MHAEHQNPDVRIGRQNAAGCFNSVHLRHSDIHHHDIRSVLFGEFDTGTPVSGLRNYGHIRLPLNQRANALAYYRVIVSQQYANGRHRPPFDPVR